MLWVSQPSPNLKPLKGASKTAVKQARGIGTHVWAEDLEASQEWQHTGCVGFGVAYIHLHICLCICTCTPMYMRIHT